MEFDDLIALFADNTTGDIGASDVRTALNELYVRISAIENATGTTNSKAFTGRWTINTTVGATPSAGEMSVNTGGWDTATLLRFNIYDLDAIWQQNRLYSTSLYLQKQDDWLNWRRYTVTGSPNI